jgi:uncharacterized repeat protein (TIGR01451 family)
MRGSTVFRWTIHSLFVLTLSAQIAHAATVSVTSFAETGAGTLADAINQANSGACASPCTITFASGGTITISSSFLPAITALNVTINGYSAPGASVNTNAFGLADNAVILVALQGPGGGTGIDVGATATGATIRGLAIGGFNIAISLNAANGAVKGNFIGTDTSGINYAGNSTALQISATAATIGGNDADRNVISGNSDAVVFDLGASSSVVEGNYIGLRADVVVTLISGNIGVTVATNGGTGHQIGTAGRGNLVNGFSTGIQLDTNGNSVKANRIGTNADGTNAGTGSTVGLAVGGDSNTIGGTGAGEANQFAGNVAALNIAGNGNSFTGNFVGTNTSGTALPVGNFDAGVIVYGANNSIKNNTIKASNKGILVYYLAGNAILDNVIAENQNIGIELIEFFEDGPTPNDIGDVDPFIPGEGGNNIQNFPVIHSATLSGGTLTLDVAVDSSGVASTAAFRLQTFKAESSGINAQGAMLIDSRCVAGNKIGPFALTIPAAPVAVGDQLVMTATSYTDAGCTTIGDGTSEFTFPAATIAASLVVTNTNDSGAGSLRQAITDANACSGPCTIVFNIPAPWPPVIQPATPLPAITAGGTVVDGGTQTIFSSDANPNGPDVILDGTSAGVGANGFTIDASGVSIRGFVIRRFNGAGIVVTDASLNITDNVIAGNYIGIDANGTTAAGNGTGIRLADHATNTMIGGSNLQDRNVISGNSGDGVLITGSTAQDSLVLGNYIGTDAAGAAAVPNNRGVAIENGANGNHIGSYGSRSVRGEAAGRPVTASTTKDRVSSSAFKPGKPRNKAVTANSCGCTPTPDNIISGNTVAGVALISAGGGGSIIIGDSKPGSVEANGSFIFGLPNTVTNDFIGTDASGSLPLPNGVGVQVGGTTFAAIIGEPFLSNIIAFNTGAGVTVTDTATGTSIRGNEIRDNGGLGIDLNADGVTANDALDADPGPNDLTNFPLIVATGVSEGGGVIHAQPSTSYEIDVYASTSADPSGNGEGTIFVGSSDVTTDAAGDGYFAFPTGAPPNYWITLTATNNSVINRTTSEFSPAVQMYATPGTTAAVVDVASKTIPSHVFVGDSPQSVAWNGNTTAVVALEGSKLVRLDMTKTPPPITDTLTLPLTNARNVEINAAGTRALVTGDDALAVYVNLTTTPMTIAGTATLPSVNPGGIIFYNGDAKGLIADNDVLALLDLTVVPVIPVTSVPFTESGYIARDLAINPAGDRAVLSLDAGVTLLDLTVDPPSVMGTDAGIAEDGQGVAITPDGTKSLFLETGRVGESAPTLFVHDITGSSPVSISSMGLPDWVPSAIRVLPSGTAVIATKFGVLFVDPPYTALTTVVTDSPLFSGSALDSLDVNAAATKALNLNVDTAALYPDISCTASLPFGSVAVGTSSTLSVNCTNTGGATLTISSFGVTGTGFSLGTTPATPFAIDPSGSFNYQVVFTPPSAGPFNGTATVINNGVPGNGATTLTGTGFLQSDLSITKTDGVITVIAGSTVTYTITVTNGGPSPATSVPVTDNFSGTITGVNWTCGASVGSSCGSGGGSGNINTTVNLASGGTATFSATGTVAPSATGTLSNTANVGVPAGVTDPNLTNNSATDNNTAITQSANLSITKNGPATVTPGQNIVYTITVNNAGPSDASGVSVADPTPPGLGFVSNTGDCTTAYPCALGTMTPGQTKVITTTFSVPSGYTGSVTNSATVSSTTTDPNLTNNTTTVTAGGSSVANLSITKTGPANVTAGQNITYTITVTNAGPSDAAAVSVADPNSPGLNFVSNSGDCTTAFPCALGTVTAGGTKVITAVFNVPASFASPTVTNTATVSSTTPDSSSANNSSSATTTVAPGTTDVSVSKTGPASAIPGQQVSFTVTVTNLGPAAAANVTVNDPATPGLTFVSNSGGCASAYPCSLGTLANGATVGITSTYSIPSNATGSVSNTATVSTTTPESNASNNSSTANVSLTPQANLSVSKGGPSSAIPGSNVTYTITLSNLGPSDAAGVVLSDPTPSGLTFVSASGSGCTNFPCTIGALPAGQTRTVQATYTVTGASGSVTNTATATSSTTDPNGTNNSGSATTITACPETPLILGPANGATNVAVNGNLTWSNVGAGAYKVYFGAGAAGCQTLITTTTSTTVQYTVDPGTEYQWRVEAITPGCPVKTSICAKFTTLSNCPLPPALLSPANGTQVASPVLLSWSSVPGAINYTVFASVNNGPTTNLGTTASTSMILDFSDGPVVWFVVANAGAQCQLRSATGSFNACNEPPQPVAQAVSEIQTNQTYAIEWDDLGAVRYEVDESTSPNFASNQTNTNTTTLTRLTFQHTAAVATGYYYRVRGFSACGQKFGPNSETVRVVIAPIPPPDDPNANAPLGSVQPVILKVFIPGFPGLSLPFTARVDRPWATVAPVNGILPPSGILLTITVDPTGLPAGTWDATVIVTILNTPSSFKQIVPLGETVIKVPVSVSIVTPVGVTKSTEPPANALVIPTAGHLAGINSKWQSDIRMANTGFSRLKYQLIFTPAGPSAASSRKQTTLDVDAGSTIALNDIVRNWYGIGSLGESANGVLEIRPLSGVKKAGGVVPEVDVQTVSVASSRTYNVTSKGTLGQFIPAVAFSSFISKAGASGFTPILGLQQIAQSDVYRTNLGVVEGGGKPASVLISAFDGKGTKLLDFPLDLAANEQKQLNGFLASNNITVPDGRLEVKVTAGDGKVTAYASVIDNDSGDPLAVNGVQLRAQGADHYVLPGVATLQNEFVNWQSDVRIFNAGNTPQTATLTYFPQNDSGASQTTALTINAGETKAIDNALPSLFAATNTGGALHVTTPTATDLVVSARTYNQTTHGTFGQFIPAVTAADGVGAGAGSLQILQVEESVRYRTNIGIFEVDGKPATVELSIFVPESKTAARTTFDLKANEFRQLNVLREAGFDDVYNARIQVRVLSGTGKIAAYGSVIDMITQDPTFVPAQPSQ